MVHFLGVKTPRSTAVFSIIILAALFLSSCSRESLHEVIPVFTPGTAPMENKWSNLSPRLQSLFATGDGKNEWAVGDAGTILHSTDAQTWKRQTSNTTNFLRSVYGAYDGKNVWVVGNGGTILHSTDEETWKQQTSNTTHNLWFVYATGDGKNVWAVGDAGTILHSADGETWKQQTSNTTNNLLSAYGTSDGKNLWAVGAGTILHSSDGETWKDETNDATKVRRSVYETGDGKNVWVVGSGGTILHSTDEETWKQQTSNTTHNLWSVYGTGDGKNFWAVGEAGTILHSTDGETWKQQTSNTTSALLSVHGTGDGKNVWAVGEAGTILYSADGETWEQQTGNTASVLRFVSGTGDGKSLWAVGHDGTILHSANGETWKQQTTNTTNNLWSVYGTGDGKNFWGVGEAGTILHSTDGETWKQQASNTTNNLLFVYGAGDGKNMWVVGTGGTILHSTDGETWRQQTSNTSTDLYSVYRTSDGKNMWMVGTGGTILHSTDGETWKQQTSKTDKFLQSVYGTGDGKSVWAVGDVGTILYSADGETWKQQTSNTTVHLSFVYGTSDGKNVWAVGERGSILHSTDGETWKQQTSNTTHHLLFVYGTSDGKNLWAVGSAGTILHSAQASRAPYLDGAELVREVKGTFLNLKIACPDPDSRPIGLRIIGWNSYKFTKNKEGSPITVKGEIGCGVLKVPVDLDDLEMGAGDRAYFGISLDSDSTSVTYHYGQKYDPWRWFIDHKKELFILAAILAVFSILCLFWIFRPLWNLRLYFALKQPLVERLFKIPVVGSALEMIFTVCTFGLPWFVVHSRTLDAWVAEQRSMAEGRWAEQTLPARAAVSERQRFVEATPYVPLPLRIGDPSTGTLISQPTSDEIAKRFSEKRTVIQVIGPGGAGKTTFARQCGLWALMGHPGGLRSTTVMPLWIDEDMAADKNPLTDVVKNKLAAVLPDVRTDDLLLNALLRKQRILVIVDRLSERSLSTQEYLKKIYSFTRAEAMIITTRNPIAIDGVTCIKLFPQPLDENTLLYFMQALLQLKSVENHVEPIRVSLDDQMTLDKKLSALYRKSVRGDGNILPLPVRLFVEEAKVIIADSGSLDSLPQSIPDVYSRYLERVNPDNPSVPNFMSQGEMLRAAEVLAKLALGDDFIPKEFDAGRAVTELKKEGWTDPQKINPVQRLLDNGILIPKGELINRRLKFVLDPIAEHLAAAAYLQELGRDSVRLDLLRDRARNAPGFLVALDLLTRTATQSPNSNVVTNDVVGNSSS
jgi:photosystem II stability/assembly factor-like uncharacterized protein